MKIPHGLSLQRIGMPLIGTTRLFIYLVSLHQKFITLPKQVSAKKPILSPGCACSSKQTNWASVIRLFIVVRKFRKLILETSKIYLYPPVGWCVNIRAYMNNGIIYSHFDIKLPIRAITLVKPPLKIRYGMGNYKPRSFVFVNIMPYTQYEIS